jgi:hypothetical protein
MGHRQTVRRSNARSPDSRRPCRARATSINCDDGARHLRRKTGQEVRRFVSRLPHLTCHGTLPFAKLATVVVDASPGERPV